MITPVSSKIAYRLTAFIAMLFIVGIVTQLTLIQIQANQNAQLIRKYCETKH